MTIAQERKRNGPMFCSDPDCAAWRQREPVFCQQLQDAGVVAHYMGHDSLFDETIWMLDGITPVTRASLMQCLKPAARTNEDGWP